MLKISSQMEKQRHI